MTHEADGEREIGRRDFLALSGAGLFVLFWTDPKAAQEPERLPDRGNFPTDFNAYLHIGPDGRVTCLVGKVELGQGSKTTLAQLAAEELDVAFESVEMVMGDTDLCPWDIGTFGSLAVRQFGPVLRAAAAEARAVLLQMAAERLAAPAHRLTVKFGLVTDPAAPGKQVSYGELVRGKRIERHLDAVKVKSPAAFAIIGRSPRRKDALEKVTGQAKYTADMAIPGTLHARILRPPAHGATLKELDTSAAEKVAGARVVREKELVAVLHARPDQAELALSRLKSRFDLPPAKVDDKTVFAHLLEAAPQPRVLFESGSLAEGEKLATRLFTESYLNSYVAHAPIETHSAVAAVEKGKVTVWASTQAPFMVKQQVAQALGLSADKVRVVTPYVGGGFGGKSASRQAVEAAQLARLTGKPVQVVWDRGEEFFYDTFRPAAVVKIRSGLTRAGRIPFWDYAVYCAGEREATQFYDIPHQRTVSAGGWQEETPGLHPFAIGPWRAPSANTNTFARESHIDALALGAGADPVEFRLAHLSDKRMRRVLEVAAKRFGWRSTRGPGGLGMGAACAIHSGTYLATLAEVAVDKETGRVQPRRVTTAVDHGLTVNPDGSRQQIEGCISMGLGYALTEEIHFKGGDVLDRNFDSYPIPRFSWMPKIEAVLVENPETPATGCGEAPIITMGAVIANAVHGALGVRLLQLPMTPDRIKAALAKR